jgi:hypothetical protein
MAKTRCRLLDCNEKPATNSAGATVAPSGRRHRRGRGEQRDADAGDRNRTRQHRSDRQKRTASTELVDDQHHDQGQAAEHRYGHRRIRESVAGQLCGADESRRAPDGRQCDCRPC